MMMKEVWHTLLTRDLWLSLRGLLMDKPKMPSVFTRSVEISGLAYIISTLILLIWRTLGLVAMGKT
jgi:hypothetical protein